MLSSAGGISPEREASGAPNIPGSRYTAKENEAMARTSLPVPT